MKETSWNKAAWVIAGLCVLGMFPLWPILIGAVIYYYGLKEDKDE